MAGLWIPLVTPFRAGAVDHGALAALVRDLRPKGIAGFVACGSTGEAAALDDAEQLAVLDTVREAAAGLPVMMGLSGYHLPHLLDRLAAAAQRPLAGVLVAAPCYVRPAQAGLLQWFTALADASPVPLVLYDIPYRTGVKLELATLLALADHPRIRAIKDCGGDAAKTQALLADGRLQVLAGEDAQIFTTMALGGAGAIAASAHRHTEKFVAVMRLVAAGRLAEARALWEPLQPWIQAAFAEPNPSPLKAVLAHHGAMALEFRPPMTPASDALLARLLAVDQALSR
nr:dihydrodipicolinate synthase family protein [Rhodoferax koreense]